MRKFWNDAQKLSHFHHITGVPFVENTEVKLVALNKGTDPNDLFNLRIHQIGDYAPQEAIDKLAYDAYLNIRGHVSQYNPTYSSIHTILDPAYDAYAVRGWFHNINSQAPVLEVIPLDREAVKAQLSNYQFTDRVKTTDIGQGGIASFPQTRRAVQAFQRVKTQPTLEPGIIRYANRDIIKVRLKNGTIQPFYRSTGHNSGMAGRWLPFDGILPMPGGGATHWFNKSRFSSGELNSSSHPLHRFGTEELKEISNWLGSQNIEQGQELHIMQGMEVNDFLGTTEAIKSNEAYEAMGLGREWHTNKRIQDENFKINWSNYEAQKAQALKEGRPAPPVPSHEELIKSPSIAPPATSNSQQIIEKQGATVPKSKKQLKAEKRIANKAAKEAKRSAQAAEKQAQAEAAEAARQAAKAAQQAANEAAQTVAEAKGAQQALAQADTPVAGKAAVEVAKDAIKGLGNLERGALSKAGLAGAGAAGAFAIWALARNERRSQISPRRRDANVQVAPESFDTTNRRSIAMGAMAAGAALAGAPIKGISPQQRALLGIGGALGLAVGVGKATGEDTSSAVLGTAITGSIAAIAYSLLSKNGGKGVGVLRNFLTKHGPKAQLDAAALASQKAQNDIGGLTKYLSAQNIAIAGGLLTLPAAHSLMVKHFASEKRRTTDHSDVAFLPAWQDNKAGSTKWRKSNDPLFVSNPSNTASVNFNGAVYSHYNSSSIFENF